MQKFINIALAVLKIFYVVKSTIFQFMHFFFPTKKTEQLQNDNHSIGLTLMYALNKVVAGYYNIIITYERK